MLPLLMKSYVVQLAHIHGHGPNRSTPNLPLLMQTPKTYTKIQITNHMVSIHRYADPKLLFIPSPCAFSGLGDSANAMIGMHALLSFSFIVRLVSLYPVHCCTAVKYAIADCINTSSAGNLSDHLDMRHTSMGMKWHRGTSLTKASPWHQHRAQVRPMHLTNP